jgi:predicted HicB family RNase H-like nuclease
MLRLELQPEVEAQLAAEAQARGVALDRYVAAIVARTA